MGRYASKESLVKIILFILMLISFPSYSTQQIEEVFIADGSTNDVKARPLEELYKFDDILAMLQSQGFCSANWRGYKGTWELKGNELFLNSMVNGACDENAPLVDSVLFFGEKSFPFKVVWFNGVIEVITSDVIPYVDGRKANGDPNYLGYDYDAIIYEFSSGELINKSEKKIKFRF